jgi:hypothetical protein
MVSRIAKFIKTESRMVVARAWEGEENRELVINQYNMVVGENEKLLKIRWC